MPRLRPLARLFALAAAFVWPMPASASTPASSESRVQTSASAVHVLAAELAPAQRECLPDLERRGVWSVMTGMAMRADEVAEELELARAEAAADLAYILLGSQATKDPLGGPAFGVLEGFYEYGGAVQNEPLGTWSTRARLAEIKVHAHTAEILATALPLTQAARGTGFIRGAEAAQAGRAGFMSAEAVQAMARVQAMGAAANEARAAAEAARAAATAAGGGARAYSTAFEARLASSSYPGVSRARHFQEANEQLLRAMESSPEFAAQMRGLGINIERTATGLAPRTPPAGWTWHHEVEAGVMRLVPRAQHTPGSPFWDVLHPGGRGGYSIWRQ